MLETTGRVAIKEGTSELLKLPLRCHMCRRELPTIPALKEHLKSHFSTWESVYKEDVKFNIGLHCVGRYFCPFIVIYSFMKLVEKHLIILWEHIVFSLIFNLSFVSRCKKKKMWRCISLMLISFDLARSQDLAVEVLHLMFPHFQTCLNVLY